jgi:hypothetical protein
VKRYLFLGIPILFGLGALVTVVTATMAFPTAAQEAVDRYLVHLDSQSSVGAERTELIIIDRARRPWNLCADYDNYPIFAADKYYQGDLHYDQPTIALETALWSDKIVTSSADDDPALLFPPEELWCGLVSTDGHERVIWIARHHREPYYTEWVIHQGPYAPFPESLHATLVAVNCELGDIP